VLNAGRGDPPRPALSTAHDHMTIIPRAIALLCLTAR
jgi:hypothetical protein